MGFSVFWLAIMALAALIVLPKIKEWHEQGLEVNVPYREMWQKHIFRYQLPITPEDAIARLSDCMACAGVAYDFDFRQMQITLRSKLPDGTVPVTFQLSFEPGVMVVTRLTRTTKAGPIQLAMGAFWREKLGAEFLRCA